MMLRFYLKNIRMFCGSKYAHLSLAFLLVSVFSVDYFLVMFIKNEINTCGIATDFYHRETMRGRGRSGHFIVVYDGFDFKHFNIEKNYIKKKIKFNKDVVGKYICLSYIESPTGYGENFITEIKINGLTFFDQNYSSDEFYKVFKYKKYFSPFSALLFLTFTILALKKPKSGAAGKRGRA